MTAKNRSHDASNVESRMKVDPAINQARVFTGLTNLPLASDLLSSQSFVNLQSTSLLLSSLSRNPVDPNTSKRSNKTFVDHGRRKLTGLPFGSPVLH